MIDAITTMFGTYTPLAGDGIASLNFTWIVAVLFTLLFTWFLLKLAIRFFDWICGRNV